MTICAIAPRILESPTVHDDPCGNVKNGTYFKVHLPVPFGISQRVDVLFTGDIIVDHLFIIFCRRILGLPPKAPPPFLAIPAVHRLYTTLLVVFALKVYVLWFRYIELVFDDGVASRYFIESGRAVTNPLARNKIGILAWNSKTTCSNGEVCSWRSR